MTEHAQEVSLGKRFEFGVNWTRFLALVNEDRIRLAEHSLRDLLEAETFQGKTFLDIGSGSGLFSLAARRLGAKVRSFDFDPQSVACTRELKRRYFPDDPEWTIEQGSVLDQAFLVSLGTFDVVYSWGVLHHTRAMWEALENVTPLVKPQGRLYIAIYNDQGRASVLWKLVKRAYCRTPEPVRSLILGLAFVRLWGPTTVRDCLQGRPGRTWHNYGKRQEGPGRGMSPWRDVVDWVGGYPFEVAKPEQIFDFYRDRGFVLSGLITCAGGKGCNEFVFTREP
ncbi:MAG: class I SAM-dependent methyltransferase [Gammaproteobacteria bacterium]